MEILQRLLTGLLVTIVIFGLLTFVFLTCYLFIQGHFIYSGLCISFLLGMGIAFLD